LDRKSLIAIAAAERRLMTRIKAPHRAGKGSHQYAPALVRIDSQGSNSEVDFIHAFVVLAATVNTILRQSFELRLITQIDD